MEGRPFAGKPEGYERKALETGISLYGRSVGAPAVGSTRVFERRLKGALEVKRLSLKRLSGKGLLYWGPWKICKERVRIRASLSTRAPLRPRETWKGDRYRVLIKMNEGL